MGFFIPETMKQFNNWLVWCKEWSEKENKFKKIPYSPKTHKKALKNGICSFSIAFDVFTYMQEYDGIGFFFTQECNMTFVDLDHCIDEEGNYSPLAEELTETFKDCYIELSQSETGLHIVALGMIPYSFNNRTIGIEMYSINHYVAMTCNAINQNEPQEATERLQSIFDRYKPIKAENEPQAQEKPQGQMLNNVEDILNKIRNSRQAEKFEMLHNGEWERVIAENGKPYPSQSEADQAYINIVNYFTNGNDAATIDIYTSSKLSDRQKAHREDYIQGMINKAKITATGSQGISKRTNTRIIDEVQQLGRRKRRVRV